MWQIIGILYASPSFFIFEITQISSYNVFVGHLHQKANEVNPLPRGLFLKYSILTLAVHRKSTVGAVNHFLSLLTPSCYKGYWNLWCTSKLLCQWIPLGFPTDCSRAHSFSSLLPVLYLLPAYTHWIRIPQEQFSSMAFSGCIREIFSRPIRKWFGYLSATYTLLTGLFSLCTRPDWKL